MMNDHVYLRVAGLVDYVMLPTLILGWGCLCVWVSVYGGRV